MEISTRHLACFTPAVWVGWNQLKLDQSSCGARDLKGNSVACHGTSDLDFNKEGCVRQI